MNRKKGLKGSMILKLDLQKAYDNLDWEFLEFTLKDFGLPVSFVNRVMYLIKESSISIMWNGGNLLRLDLCGGSDKGTRLPRTSLSWRWKISLGRSNRKSRRVVGYPYMFHAEVWGCHTFSSQMTSCSSAKPQNTKLRS